MASAHRIVLIIGAARSGTKLLRRLLGAAPESAVVPYGVSDVWKRGHEGHPNDALPRSTCTDATARRIRTELARLATDANQSRILIEKTSANALRVPFVEAVYPEARFIHLIRDGVDVVESARRRWHARPEWEYLIRKALALRWTGIRRGIRYLWRRVQRNTSSTLRLWGPHYPGMADDVRTRSLVEVCARQWRACVDSALDALDDLPDERVLSLRYETLVQDPSAIDQLAAFAGISSTDVLYAFHDDAVETRFIGRGRRRLSAAEQETIRPIVRRPLARLGYAPIRPHATSP